MTSTRLPQPAPRSVFADHEPVVQSHPLLPDARPPRFSHTDTWDLNGAVERPVNQPTNNYRISFASLNPTWNLRAREMAMTWLNPRHSAVLEAGVYLKPQPLEPRTVVLRVGNLRSLAAWAAEQHLPDDLAGWDPEDFHHYIHACAQRLAIGSVNEHIVVIKALHQFAPVLANQGLPADPWPGRPASHVLGLRYSDELSTPVIPPEAWFPLVQAAWTYINTFGPDILRARATWQGLQAKARPLRSRASIALTHWLANPNHRIPVHTRAGDALAGKVNWSMLGVMIGASDNVFHSHTSSGQRLRAQVLAEVAAGRRTQTGVITDLHKVTRRDGSTGPWHPGLHPRQMWLECIALRNACYIFSAALSMMRDSEIRAITRDSVVEHYGAPAVAATKRKRDPDLPTRHWWIIGPVAQALFTAAELSEHPELTFASVRGTGNENELFASITAIEAFIERVNTHREHTGLAAIPPTGSPRTCSAAPWQCSPATTPARRSRWACNSNTPPRAPWPTAPPRATPPAPPPGPATSTTPSPRPGSSGSATSTTRTAAASPSATAPPPTGSATPSTPSPAPPKPTRVTPASSTTYCAAPGSRCGSAASTTAPSTKPTPPTPNASTPRSSHPDTRPTRRPLPARPLRQRTSPIWRTEEHSLLTLLDTPNLAACRRAQLHRELDDVRAVLRKVTP